jgi:prepilin-type N-terminal cleavage/methylation domain-containing protein
MKTPRASQSRRGFTLIELLVAMTITTIIVTVLVSITSIAIDTWNRSRSELRAASQAKTMVDSMTRDLEALVVRRGNVNEWLYARIPSDLPANSSNAADLMFFSAPTDRYDGQIGTANDKGGDVSFMAYRLYYRDPIAQSGNFKTYVLNRLLLNPDETFNQLLGKTDMSKAISGTTGNNTGLDKVFTDSTRIEDEKNFVCENIFQFSVTFHLQISRTTTSGSTSTTQIYTLPLTLPRKNSPSVDQLSITGGGVILQDNGSLVTSAVEGYTREEILASRVSAVSVSLTVLSDGGVDLLRKNPDKANDAAWLAKNSFQYSKLIQLPGM